MGDVKLCYVPLQEEALREHSGNIEDTFTEHGTFEEYKGTFGEHSEKESSHGAKSTVVGLRADDSLRFFRVFRYALQWAVRAELPAAQDSSCVFASTFF